MFSLILASGSSVRADLLERSRVPFRVELPRVDESAIKESMLATDASTRDIADALAQAKANKVANRNPDALVLGCDQVLEFENTLLSKCDTPGEALALLNRIQGKPHKLLSAAVIYDQGKPVWRHVGEVRLLMRKLTDTFLADYIDRNWESVSGAVGCYKLEEEGPRLFSRIEGDHFNVLGMPLLEILSYLKLRGDLAT